MIRGHCNVHATMAASSWADNSLLRAAIGADGVVSIAVSRGKYTSTVERARSGSESGGPRWECRDCPIATSIDDAVTKFVQHLNKFCWSTVLKGGARY